MFNEREMSKAIDWLFELFSPEDYEGYDEDEIGYAGGLCLPEVCTALRGAAQTVYQYSVAGGYEKCFNYRGMELFDQRACLIISDVEQAVLDEIKTTYETELWLMEDMNFAIVRCVSMLIGSDDTGYVTEYRAFKKILKNTVTGEYTDYDIPGEALTDTRFANMIREAEKYLGYPYVWGGSSPSTSFDCSGFVSWVINNCGNGWSVGRLTANGLMGVCDIIPRSSAKPGDLIFFQGTYDTSGASHVGIYVGNGMMIHCGNPISYASIETSYWQQHFYCFGRIRN